MAVEEAPLRKTLLASGDMSNDQYKFVRIDSNGRMAVAGLGYQVVGVLQDKPAAAGRAGRVHHGGTTKVKAGGNITAGAYVTTDASGLAVAVTSGDAVRLGQALEAGQANQIISMFFQPRAT